ncbi:MAG: trigger factor [Pseudomonadota bacterium]
MQVTETLSEGLKREIQVTIPAADLDGQLTAKLNEIKDKVQLKGFRPGKVPFEHLKKLYGKSVMAEVLETAVNEATRKTLEDRDEKPAFQPDVKMSEDQAEIEQVLAGTGDLSYTIAFEVLPDFDVADLKTIKLDRLKPIIPDADIDQAINQLAENNRPFTPRDGAGEAQSGDRVTMDYTGRIDGEAFDGGSDTDADIIIGSNMFIPGFEDQLVGIKASETKTIPVTFPEDYPADHLAGKAAEFEVTAKAIAEPGEVTVDDTLAEKLGLENLDALREAITGQMRQELEGRGREKTKRALLDALDEAHTFDLPQTLVDREFEGIWGQVQQDMERAGKTFEDEDTTEEKAHADYLKISERRVRLGLVLAEIGEKGQVQVSDDEVNRALMNRIRQFPGQEQQVWEFYQQNPGAVAELRAPLFEEKVVDYILELADVTDIEMEREAFLAELAKDEDHDHDHDHDHK